MPPKPRKSRPSIKSYETVDRPQAPEQVKFPPRTRTARPRTYAGRAARAKQQTLTQIDFVRRIPDSDADEDFDDLGDEFGEAFEEALRVEEADEVQNGRKIMPLTGGPSKTQTDVPTGKKEEETKSRKRRKTMPELGSSSKAQRGSSTIKSEEAGPRPAKRRKTMTHEGPTLTQIDFVVREPSDDKEVDPDYGFEGEHQGKSRRKSVPERTGVPGATTRRDTTPANGNTQGEGASKSARRRKSMTAVAQASKKETPKPSTRRKTMPKAARVLEETSSEIPKARKQRSAILDADLTVEEVPKAKSRRTTISNHGPTLTQIEFVTRTPPDDTQADPTYVVEEAYTASRKRRILPRAESTSEAQARPANDDEEDDPAFQTQQAKILRKRITRPTKLVSTSKTQTHRPPDDQEHNLEDRRDKPARATRKTKPIVSSAESSSRAQPKPTRTTKRKRVLVRGKAETEMILEESQRRAQEGRELNEDLAMPPPTMPKTPTKKTEVRSSQSPDSPFSAFSRSSLRITSRSPLKERSSNILISPLKAHSNSTVSILQRRQDKDIRQIPRLEVRDTYSSENQGLENASLGAKVESGLEWTGVEEIVDEGNEEHDQQLLDSQLTSSTITRSLQRDISPRRSLSKPMPGNIPIPAPSKQPNSPKRTVHQPSATQIKAEISDSGSNDSDDDLQPQYESYPLPNDFDLEDYNLALNPEPVIPPSRATTVNPSQPSPCIPDLPRSSQTQPSLPHNSSENNQEPCPSEPIQQAIRPSQATTTDVTQTQFTRLQHPEIIFSSSPLRSDEVMWDGRPMTESQLLPDSLMNAIVPLPPDWEMGLSQLTQE